MTLRATIRFLAALAVGIVAWHCVLWVLFKLMSGEEP